MKAAGTDQQLVRRVRRRLLGWALHSGRDFWWRHQRDPYVTAIVEILLKQTRADSVASEIEAFVLHYRSPEVLANTPMRRLVNDLRPFGFQRQRAAQLKSLGIALSVQGRGITSNEKDLLSLPGIGPYAASAIRCFVYGKKEPVIDVNIVRIVQRVFGVRIYRGEGRRNKEIKRLASFLLNGGQPRRMNWALLDFGAQVCTERNPNCDACPLLDSCHDACERIAA